MAMSVRILLNDDSGLPARTGENRVELQKTLIEKVLRDRLEGVQKTPLVSMDQKILLSVRLPGPELQPTVAPEETRSGTILLDYFVWRHCLLHSLRVLSTYRVASASARAAPTGSMSFPSNR